MYTTPYSSWEPNWKKGLKTNCPEHSFQIGALFRAGTREKARAWSGEDLGQEKVNKNKNENNWDEEKKKENISNARFHNIEEISLVYAFA